MKRSTILKSLLPLLFALAIIFGLAQRKQDPYVAKNNNPAIQQLNNSSSGQDKNLKDYYDKAQELAKQNTTETKASFLAVGDIMLSRNVAGVIKKAGNPLLPFSKLADIFKQVDFSVGNLESPFSGSNYFNPSGSMVFNVPLDNIKGLTANKFKLVTLANNHALDQGIKGLKYTQEYLDENNIKHVGTGNNLTEAWQPQIIDANGIKIGFVAASYASVNDNGKTANSYVARIEDSDNLKSSILNLKSKADFIVVLMHAGVEYKRSPNPAQIDFAHAAIDNGADMVIGSHPHWIQTTEKYSGKYIFYSLGNFIFDQEWSQDTKEGLALKITLKTSKQKNPTVNGAAGLDDLQGSRIKAELDQVELLPVIIENYSTPRLANEQESKRVLEKIGQQSTVIKP